MFLLASGAVAQAAKSASYGQAVTLGTLQDPAINESSGVAASRRNPGLFWTHNDSGDGPFVYALGPHGEKRGTFRLRGVSSVTDCEDIAVGPGPQPGVPYLYLADIGDNTQSRGRYVIWRVPEPKVTPATAKSSRTHPILTASAELLGFSYPDGPHDAETLLVNPKGDCFVVTKNKNGLNGVYLLAFPQGLNTFTRMTKVSTIRITDEPPIYPNLITGGDISPDGRRFVLRTYWYAYEYRIPKAGSASDPAWNTFPTRIALPLQAQGEGICYTYPKGDALVLTSEGKGTTVYELRRK